MFCLPLLMRQPTHKDGCKLPLEFICKLWTNFFLEIFLCRDFIHIPQLTGLVQNADVPIPQVLVGVVFSLIAASEISLPQVKFPIKTILRATLGNAELC